MKVKALDGEDNTGILKPIARMISNTNEPTEFDWIEIKKGRYIQSGTSHPLRSGHEKYYKRIYCLEHGKRIIYWFETFGIYSKDHGVHVSFSWFEHQQFLWKQDDHWLQKEENLRFIVNVIFLIIGVIVAVKGL
jgi:hypothetical protein